MRAELAERLEARRPEIEQAALTRIYAISDPAEAADPEYADGLRAALSAALDYGFAAIRYGEDRTTSIPAALLTQARMAARNGINLDTVLRRYFAGYALLGDLLIEEAEQADLPGSSLKRLLRSQAALFDRLLTAVSEEHTLEAETRPHNAEQRRVERVQRLLAGEILGTTDLGYEFDAQHVGAIASGPGGTDAFRDLAAALDHRLLLVCRSAGTVWAWLGGRHGIDLDELERVASARWPKQVSLAVGEPGQGFAGWRLTHQQARAALLIALRSSKGYVRYADVAVLASMLQDDLLVTSLRERYLAPLAQERDGGEALRATLRAYFAAERQTSSAAVALGVSRQTVINRLRVVEERLGRTISSSAAEVEAALHLDDLGYAALP
jgi:DNA-binding PucR family transcriptional regulator